MDVNVEFIVKAIVKIVKIVLDGGQCEFLFWVCQTDTFEKIHSKMELVTKNT